MLSGISFDIGKGKAASSMTSTQKVLGFIGIFGQWQADLSFVMM
jgi:hypothetical protein